VTTETTNARHQELSDEDVDRVSIDDLRTAYRSLRDHHIAETTALISRRDDLTRRRDEQLDMARENLTKTHKLVERADELIDRLGTENARLSEIVDYMQNRYSPIGGRSCALCVYEEGRFIRSCAMHRWDDVTAKVLTARAADPEDLDTTDHLSNEELAAWAESVGLYQEQLEHSYLRLIIDELRDRRDAEALFVELDRRFQDIVDCTACDDGGPDGCAEHKPLIRLWRNARSALCDLARIHRGYLLSLNAPSGGDPR